MSENPHPALPRRVFIILDRMDEIRWIRSRVSVTWFTKRNRLKANGVEPCKQRL